MENMHVRHNAKEPEHYSVVEFNAMNRNAHEKLLDFVGLTSSRICQQATYPRAKKVA